MPSDAVIDALERLRAAADTVNASFPSTTWTKVSGPGPDALTLEANGGFHGLTLEPGRELVLRSTLELPAGVAGVPLADGPLLATLFSLYPCDIAWNGSSVFAEEGVPVAAGPALFTIVPALQAGSNGETILRVRVPDNQTTTWFQLRLTTPGLRARFEMLDVAWAQLALADALAVRPEERAAVERATDLVPGTLPVDSEALAEVLNELAVALAPVAAKTAAVKVHLVGHSHIDMNWMWTWSDTVEVIKRDFRSVLALMDDYPELTFSHSQPATYEVIREQEPALFARTLERIREGRWEPISMTWVEGDVNMASGEAHARQLLEGVRYTRGVLGAQPTTFHAPDTFGHAGNLPQLAASAGARAYYHHRANPGGEDQWPAYWWEGQDGTRLLALSTWSYNGEIHARDLAQAAIRAHKWGHPCALHFHGIGDHGGGPSRQNLDALRRFRKTPGLPTAFCSTLTAYTKELLDAGASLPVQRGESSTIFEGCYTTHADTKRYNRSGENLLCTADTLAALAGQDTPVELTGAWRTVLFNQFHDIFDGSAIHEVYDKNRTDFEEVEAAATCVTDASLRRLQAGLEPGRIAVTNPLGFDREDVVTVPGLTGEGTAWLVGDNGHVTPGQYTAEGLVFVARSPAFGTVSYAAQGETPEGATADGLTVDAPENGLYITVETPLYRAKVRRDCGILVSFHDKRAGRELVGFGMRRASDYVDTARPELALNVFQVTDERPHGMTAWQLHEVHTEHSLLSGARTTVTETGFVRVVLTVEHAVRASTIRQDIVFYRDLPRVDFQSHIEWNEVGGPEAGVPGLKAAFTARLPECEAWFETPFTAVKRPADGQEVPALRWADVGGPEYGFAVLNDSKHGYDALGCRLRLTLLRSAYDPDAISDKGSHDVRYSLLPHPGDWRNAGVVQAAMGFNQPLLARTVREPRSSGDDTGFRPILSGAPSVVISCLKRAYDGSGTILRLYESTGCAGEVKLSGLPSNAQLLETNVVEDRRNALESRDGSLTLSFHPWQVRTLLID